jgi:hypothetical protein
MIIATMGLGTLIFYLLRQGIDKAGLWVAVLGFPVAVVSATAAVWTTVLAAKALREPRPRGREALPPAEARSGVVRSGSIRQDHTRGSAVAHSGTGDVTVNFPVQNHPPKSA